MAKGDHTFRKEPRGSTNGGYARPRVQIGFDPETLKIITKLAKANKRSFAAEARELVRLGISASVGSPARQSTETPRE